MVSEAVRDHLAEKGFDENYGARPLRRVIQNEIEDAMAEEYLDGKFAQEISLHLKWMKIILNLLENNKDSGHAAYFHV